MTAMQRRDLGDRKEGRGTGKRMQAQAGAGRHKQAAAGRNTRLVDVVPVRAVDHINHLPSNGEDQQEPTESKGAARLSEPQGCACPYRLHESFIIFDNIALRKPDGLAMRDKGECERREECQDKQRHRACHHANVDVGRRMQPVGHGKIGGRWYCGHRACLAEAHMV